MASDKGVTIGYRYYLGVHMCLCHGPIDKVTQIRVDDRIAWSGESTGGNIAVYAPELLGGDTKEGGVAGRVNFAFGEAGQGQNSYLASKLGADVPTYRGVVSAILERCYMGNSPYLKKWGFRAQRIHTTSNGAVQWYDAKAEIGSGDMNPAHIIRECLTDTDWGNGVDPSYIDEPSFIAAADTLYTEGMGMSLVWSQQGKIEDFLKEIKKHINCSIRWHRQKKKYELKLIRNDYTIGDLLHLNEDNIKHVRNFKRPLVDELVNQVTVSFWDKNKGDKNSVTVQDIALSARQGATTASSVYYTGFTTGDLAAKVAARDLRQMSQPLLSCVITASRVAATLHNGDVFKFSHAEYGVEDMAMRVTDVELGTLDDNTVKLTCIQDAFDISEAIYAAPGSGLWTDPNNEPADATDRLSFETPYYEIAQIKGDAFAQALDQYSGFVTATAGRPTSDASTAKLATATGATYTTYNEFDLSPLAVLDGDIGYTDTTWTIEDDAEALEAVRVGTFAIVGDEIIRIDSYTDTTLTVGRGCLDTVPVEHPSGAKIYFCDEFSGSDQVEYTSGETVKTKVLPITGKGMLAEGSASYESVTIARRAYRPYPPGNFKVNGTAYPETIGEVDTVVSWSHRDRTLQTASIIDTTASDVGPEAGTTYEIKFYDEDDNLIKTDTTASNTYTYTLANEIADSGLGRASSSLRIVLKSIRDSEDSWTQHDFTTSRVGYGFGYGIAYGES